MMKSIAPLVASAVLLTASTVSAYGATSPGALVYKGCFSTDTGLTLNSSYIYNTNGYCQTQCAPLSYAVIGLSQSTDCYCGNEFPPIADLVDDSNCNAPCAGYGQDMCGGAQSFWSVYLSGVTASASTASADPASTSTAAGGSQTSTNKPSVVTAAGQTVVVTAPADASVSKSTESAHVKSSSGPSKAGIAAGAVVGVLGIAAIAGGTLLFVRNRKRRAVEEEYRRNAAVSDFVHGGKPPNSSGGDSAFTDTRLDAAVMAQRRMSDGSIADNQDYSRRILKVTNA